MRPWGVSVCAPVCCCAFLHPVPVYVWVICGICINRKVTSVPRGYRFCNPGQVLICISNEPNQKGFALREYCLRSNKLNCAHVYRAHIWREAGGVESEAQSAHVWWSLWSERYARFDGCWDGLRCGDACERVVVWFSCDHMWPLPSLDLTGFRLRPPASTRVG